MSELSLLAELTLPGVERSVRRAREFCEETLAPERVAPGDEILDDLVLVVDELAGNGIRHTASGRGGKITIALLADDGTGGARPVPRVNPEAESGRGLHIVDALASRWGHRPDGPRTTVWAEFPKP